MTRVTDIQRCQPYTLSLMIRRSLRTAGRLCSLRGGLSSGRLPRDPGFMAGPRLGKAQRMIRLGIDILKGIQSK